MILPRVRDTGNKTRVATKKIPVRELKEIGDNTYTLVVLVATKKIPVRELKGVCVPAYPPICFFRSNKENPSKGIERA